MSGGRTDNSQGQSVDFSGFSPEVFLKPSEWRPHLSFRKVLLLGWIGLGGGVSSIYNVPTRKHGKLQPCLVLAFQGDQGQVQIRG
jgi:hypothetical protein